MEIINKKVKHCCFCKKMLIFVWEENSSAPLKKKGKCCNLCNETIVIPARLALIVRSPNYIPSNLFVVKLT